MTDLNTILDNLGGEASVAKSLGCGMSAISNWKARGIPKGRKLDLLDLADEKGVALLRSDLEAADRAIRSNRNCAASLAAE